MRPDFTNRDGSGKGRDVGGGGALRPQLSPLPRFLRNEAAWRRNSVTSHVKPCGSSTGYPHSALFVAGRPVATDDDGIVALDNPADFATSRPSAARFVEAVYRGEPFLGRAALQYGVLTRHDLQTRFRKVHPRVFVARSAELTTYQTIRAAWLWAGPGSVLCAGTAAFLTGEEYFGTEMVDDAVQLWRPDFRTPPPGIVVRRWRAAPESVQVGGMSVTTPARTAIDLARQLDSDVRAVAALDSMCRTGRATPDAIAETAFTMAGHTGVRRVLGLLPSVDPKAESPKETELRLLMAATDLPQLESQVEVFDELGRLVSRLDLGNQEWKVGLQYDGEEHLKRERRDRDSMSTARLRVLGWDAPRVTQGMLMSPKVLIGFARAAFERQGWRS